MYIVRSTMTIKCGNYNMKVQSFNRNLNPNKYLILFIKDSLLADYTHTHIQLNEGINLIKLVVLLLLLLLLLLIVI